MFQVSVEYKRQTPDICHNTIVVDYLYELPKYGGQRNQVQQTPDVDSMFVQCWIDVADGGPTLKQHIAPFDMKGCICHFVKWQIHPFISKETNYGEHLPIWMVCDIPANMRRWPNVSCLLGLLYENFDTL